MLRESMELHSFYPDKEKFYCSQYIAEILPVFDSIPMKFNDEEKLVSDYWKEYFAKLGMEVPECLAILIMTD